MNLLSRRRRIRAVGSIGKGWWAAVFLLVVLGVFPPFPAVSSSASPAAFDTLGKPLPSGLAVGQGRFSVVAEHTAIRDILQEISRKSGIEVTAGDGITGEANLTLVDVTIEEALQILCRNRAMVYEYRPESDSYRVIRVLAVGDGQSGSAQVSAAAAAGSGASPEGSGDGTQRGQGGSLADRNAGTAPVRTVEGTGEGAVDAERDDRGRPLYKAQELLVRIKAGVSAEAVAALHNSVGSAVLEELPTLGLQKVRIREGWSEKEAAAFYAASALVAHAERHALRYPNRTADDPYFDLQWSLANLKAGDAWNITTGKAEVVIAIIDTGVDYRHPDLQGNIWSNKAEANGSSGVDDDGNGYVDDLRGWDFMGSSTTRTVPDNDPVDTDGHGTHLAGIIAAAGNNGIGIAGINWQARIMPLKVAADNSDSFDSYAIIAAIQYAIKQGARIVNCSFGGSSKSTEEEAAFQALQKAGILVTVAAGNNGQDGDKYPMYPASYPFDNIISVAASDSQDKLASFSNYGAASVDVMAPGVDVYSTIVEDSDTDALVRLETTPPVEYAALGMLFAGQTDDNGITATAYPCGQGYADEFPAGVKGNIALIKRGNRDGVGFYFNQKVLNAQAAGAKGVIIYNNTTGSLNGTLGASGDWVPAVSITQSAGAALIALGTPTVTLINKPVSVPYGYMSGTSMAAPQVAGVAGLLLAQCPSLDYQKVRSAILSTVDPIATVSGKLVSGGRVNALAALMSLKVPADLNGDCRIGLDDAVLAMRVIAGEDSTGLLSGYPLSAIDVDGDGLFGLSEAIYILQSLAGLRP